MFFLHSSLYIPKYSLRRTLYSTRSALFLIVFCESKVVKSMIQTPTCDQPSREPLPNVHIWPRLALEKGSKSAFFNGEVVAEGRIKAAAPHSGSKGNRSSQPRIAQCDFSKIPHRGKARLACALHYHILGYPTLKLSPMYYSNLIRILFLEGLIRVPGNAFQTTEP